MADIVAGFGVPHTPVFPFFVKRDGPNCETAKLFAAQKEHLAAARPDVIVMFDTDHLNTFFLDNLPIFAVGVDKAFTGPNDEPREMPVYKIPSAVDLAAHIHQASIEAGFDAALTQHYSVDHSIAVPLHFLTPEMNVPVIPFFISGHVPPLPSAQRCYALGQAVARAIAYWPAPLRVVVMGSGSFSLEVAGPRMAPGRTDGVPDPDWALRVIKLWKNSRSRTSSPRPPSISCSRPAMSAASCSTGSPCSAPSETTSRTTSPRKCRMATPTACGAGIEPHVVRVRPPLT